MEIHSIQAAETPSIPLIYIVAACMVNRGNSFDGN